MEVTGFVPRRLPCIPKSGIFDGRSAKPFSPGVSIDIRAPFSANNSGLVGCRVSTRPEKVSGFTDDGHVNYYYGSLPAIRCGGGKIEKEMGVSGTATVKKLKKKMKLLKGLSKDLTKFSDMGFGLGPGDGLVGEVKGKIISEAAELLLGQLQQLRAEEKELKRKKKEEKAKLRAARMQNMVDCDESSSSSSESSDSDNEEVVDMSRLKKKSSTEQVLNDIQSPTHEDATLTQEGSSNFEVVSSMNNVEQECSIGTTSSSFSNVGSVGCNSERSLLTGGGGMEKKIEVCMGGKCKKSGGAALLEEFRRAVGVEGAVVGCKCMGKCKDGPNVRVLNSFEADDCCVRRTPSKPLCIGVGFEDVGLIVSSFLADSPKDLELAAAS